MKFAATVLAACTLASANAATIEYRGRVEGANVLLLNGQIEYGDADKFEQISRPLSGQTIGILQGPGGKLLDALSIGTTIRQRHFATAVTEDTTSASA